MGKNSHGSVTWVATLTPVPPSTASLTVNPGKIVKGGTAAWSWSVPGSPAGNPERIR
jgi:hypothetical protein